MALWLFAGADSRGQQSSRGPVHQPVLQSLLPQLLKLHALQRLNKVSASTQLIKQSSTFISKKKSTNLAAERCAAFRYRRKKQHLPRVRSWGLRWAGLRRRSGRPAGRSGPRCAAAPSASVCPAAAAAWTSWFCGPSAGSCWFLLGGGRSLLTGAHLEGPPGGAALTILVSVVGPVGALLGVVGGDPQLQRRNAGKVLVVWKDGAASVTLPPAVWGWRCRPTLTQLAEEVDRPVVAALGRVQVDQELDVQTGHLPLQDVGDALALLVLVLPLPAADVGTTEDRRTGQKVLCEFLSSVGRT